MLPDLEIGGGQVLLLGNIQATGDEFRHFVCSAGVEGAMAERFAASGAGILSLGVQSRLDWPVAMVRLLRFARRNRIGLIHANNTREDVRFGAFLARLAGLPMVNTLHGEVPPDYAPDRRRQTLDRLARPRMRRFIAVSDLVKETWLPYLGTLGFGGDAVVTIGPTLGECQSRGPADATVRANVRAELGLDERSKVLIKVARLVDGKGHDALLSVFARVLADEPDATLLIVGDGPLGRPLDAQAEAAGLAGSVMFLGSRNDVPDLLEAADVFVFTSEHEGFGIAPLEALCMGLPVAAYDLPTLRGFIEHGKTGLLAPQGDEEALAAMIGSLLRDPEFALRMGKAARKSVHASFGTDTVRAALSATWMKAAGRKSG